MIKTVEWGGHLSDPSVEAGWAVPVHQSALVCGATVGEADLAGLLLSLAGGGWAQVSLGRRSRHDLDSCYKNPGRDEDIITATDRARDDRDELAAPPASEETKTILSLSP